MRIGILGAGQLGKMLALAGNKLGHEFIFFDPDQNACAATLGRTFYSKYDNYKSLDQFAKAVDVVTYEFENIPLTTIEYLKEKVSVLPTQKALEVTQSRSLEKNFLNSIAINTAPFITVKSFAELSSAFKKLSALPIVLKTDRLGYDGKGQQIIRSESELNSDTVKSILLSQCVLEKFIPFNKECSIVAARGQDGSIECYPLTRNIHDQGILRFSWALPSQADYKLQAKAEAMIIKIMNELQYVGVLAVEFFEVDGDLIVNEMAPRVHNSGHWTIEGTTTSQFENHIRAISSSALEKPEQRFACCMINLIGDFHETEQLRKIEGLHLHLYGKSPRPGRKIGHITICAEQEERVVISAQQACQELKIKFYN